MLKAGDSSDYGLPQRVSQTPPVVGV